jgi:hypothetical protein
LDPADTVRNCPPAVDALLKRLAAAADDAQKNAFLPAPARAAIADVVILLDYLVRHVHALEKKPDG